MERKNVIAIVTSVIALLIVLYYLKGKSSSPIQIAQSDPFSAPYTEWANGNYPSSDNMNGSNSPFQSVEVNVNIPSISQLSTDYIPIYGFTGVVAAG